jgi:hypothetical protein
VGTPGIIKKAIGSGKVETTKGCQARVKTLKYMFYNPAGAAFQSLNGPFVKL